MAEPPVMKAVILCAGMASRWEGCEDRPKQLIQICGETLLQHTERLFRARGVDDITIVSRDKRLLTPGCSFFEPTACGWTVETLLSTRALWSDRTLILLGDVFYTEQAANQITHSRQPIAFFGRRLGSRFTGSRYSELFALAFDRPAEPRILAAIERALQAAQQGGRGKLWQTYRALLGFPLNQRRFEAEILQEIDDFTDDFDCREDLQRFLDRYGQATSRSPFVRWQFRSRIHVHLLIRKVVAKLPGKQIWKPLTARLRRKLSKPGR